MRFFIDMHFIIIKCIFRDIENFEIRKYTIISYEELFLGG